jgi:hypothetical protein
MFEPQRTTVFFAIVAEPVEKPDARFLALDSHSPPRLVSQAFRWAIWGNTPEADEIGLMYMARAGYDPQESIRFWKRMEEASSGQPPEFLSTHPSHGTRVAHLEALMPKALEAYNRAQRH